MSEREPLVGRRTGRSFIPFALVAAIVRGLTVASRVDLYTELSCSLSVVFVADHAQRCRHNPVAQTNAAHLQAVVVVSVGVLSALTAQWWHHVGLRFGHARVLAIATFGLLLSDLVFVFVSKSHSHYSHKLLMIAPVLEGLFGGWASLQSASSVFLANGTVLYLGIALGPALGAFLINHPILGLTSHPITQTFYLAVAGSFLCLLWALLVLPDSTPGAKGKGRAAAEGDVEHSPTLPSTSNDDPNGKIVSDSSAVFLPVCVDHPIRHRDWSLTFLACGLFAAMMAVSVSHVKYLYAGHMYGWNASQLGYYISFNGVVRAVTLFVIMPSIISTFKPRPTTATSKPAKTRALAIEIDFYLHLAWTSLLVEFASHILVFLAPEPSRHRSGMYSEAAFVLFSALSAVGSGSVPAMHHLAMAIQQYRALDEDQLEDADVGRLVRALGILQAVGQTIIGPMLFGAMYGETVAVFPRAIFVTAGMVLLGAMTCVGLARPERASFSKGKRRKMKRWEREEMERGRSRTLKDLRGGSAGL